MALSAGTATVNLVPSDGKAVVAGAAAAAEDSSSAFGGKFKSGLFSTMANLAGPLIGIMALDKLFDFVKGGAADWGALQASVRQTNAVLTSTGGAAGVTNDSLTKLNETLSRKTAIDQATIRNGENMLLTFTNVKNGVGAGNDVFNQATGTILDMSKALGQDTKSSAMQLGKALNDPIKGVTALQRVGVTFTDQQKAQIKTMADSNDMLGAQKIILGELNKEFGGSAAASATGGAKLSLTMKDLAMNLYGLIAPLKTVGITFSTWIVTPIADAVSNLIPLEQKMVADFKKTFNAVKDAVYSGFTVETDDITNPIQKVAAVLGVIVGNIKRVVMDAGDAVRLFWAVFRGNNLDTVTPDLYAIYGAIINVGVAARDAWAKVEPFVSNWGPATLKAIGLAAAIITLGLSTAKAFELVRSGISSLATSVKVLSKVFISNPILASIAAIIAIFVLLYEKSPAFKKFIDDLMNSLAPLVDKALPQVEQAFKDVEGVISGVINYLQPVLTNVGNFIAHIAEDIKGFFQGTGQGQSAFMATFDTVKSVVETVAGAIGTAFMTAKDWVVKAADEIGRVLGYMFAPLAPILSKIWPALQAIIGNFESFISGVANVLTTLWPIIEPILHAIWQYIEVDLGFVWSIFKAAFEAIWPIVKVALDIVWNVIRDVMEVIGGVISAVLDAISGNWSGVWKDIQGAFGGILDLIVTVLRGAAELIGNIFMAPFRFIIDAVKNFGSFLIDFFHLQPVLDAIGSFFSGGVKATFSAIGEFFHATIAAWAVIFSFVWNDVLLPVVHFFEWLWTNGIKPIFDVIVTGIKYYILIWATIALLVWQYVIKPVVDVFKSLWDFISPVFTAIGNFIDTTIKSWKTLFDWIGSNIVPPVKTFFSMISDAVSAVMTFISGKIDEQVKGWKIIFDWIHDNIVQPVISRFNDIKAAIQTVMDWIGGKISDAITAWVIIFNRIQDILNGAKDKFNSFKQWISDVWNNITSTIGNALNSVGGFFSNLGSRILGAISGAATWLYDTGKNIVMGLINGISDFIGGVVNHLTQPISGAIDSVKKLLGINSPSKVFMKIGSGIVQGMTMGIQSLANDPGAALNTITSGLPGSVGVGVTGLNLPGSTNGVNGSAQTFNIYDASNPTAVAMEVARQQQMNTRLV